MGSFEKGLCWTLYKHMEYDFIKYLEYVPYTRYNRRAYSPKMLSLLLQICGYIDTIFKEMAKFRYFRKIPECDAINNLESNDYKDYNIALARSAFEKIYRLSKNNNGKLIAKLDWIGDKNLEPFIDFGKGQSPKWWLIHNKLKHNWSLAIREANMYNALEALAGAFLLNAIHYPSIELLWRMKDLETTIKTGSGYSEMHLNELTFKSLFKKAIQNLQPLGTYTIFIETPLFLYVLEN